MKAIEQPLPIEEKVELFEVDQDLSHMLKHTVLEQGENVEDYYSGQEYSKVSSRFHKLKFKHLRGLLFMHLIYHSVALNKMVTST